ncbi:MAG: 50S ribosomal protein L21 [Terriglobales bacterium]
MYAVIRSGGKQYRVAPGDVVRVEKLGAEGTIETADVLAVRDGRGLVTAPKNARVTATVVANGKGKKVQVFHYKRKKQSKKLAGHRQPYTAVRITGMELDGQPLQDAVAGEER